MILSPGLVEANAFYNVGEQAIVFASEDLTEQRAGATGRNVTFGQPIIGGTELEPNLCGGATTCVATQSCSASASAVEPVNQTMVGCAGSVTYAARATLCGPGWRVCSAAEWVAPVSYTHLTLPTNREV